MPSFETHVRRAHPILFGLLAFFAFIELVQTAVLVGIYNDDGYPSDSLRDRIRFLLFVSVWTVVFCLFYIAGFLKAAGSFLFSIASHAVFLFLTWLFWLAGAAAITASLSNGVCDSNSFPNCGKLTSAEAFAWINWILSTFSLAFIVVVGAKSARSGNGFGGALLV